MSMDDDNAATVVDIREWTERVRADPQRYPERQATEILLAAIGESEAYGDSLYLKGGVLMGIVYQSPRQTADIDFTADFVPDTNTETLLRDNLNVELRRAAARLGYPQTVCRVQSIRRQPRRNHFIEANFPALEVTVAYARRDTAAHERLERGQCPTVLNVEISFREPVHAVEFVRLGPDNPVPLRAYSLTDLVAEKLRALLQQERRQRNRRQDVYDIDFLVERVPLKSEDQHAILDALIDKAQARDIRPGPASMDAPEVRRRAAAEWDTLALEVADLPDFEAAFERVLTFYRSLPW